MQKQGRSTKEIAAALGVSSRRVAAWYREMKYSPLEYHLPTVLRRVQEGMNYTAALRSVGLSRGRNVQVVAQAIREGGVPTWKRRDWKCQDCGILLEAHDPADAEQQHWQNGTRDGAVCTFCESREEPSMKETGLTVICAWCGKHLRGPRNSDPPNTSHGICTACEAKLTEEETER